MTNLIHGRKNIDATTSKELKLKKINQDIEAIDDLILNYQNYRAVLVKRKNDIINSP